MLLHDHPPGSLAPPQPNRPWNAEVELSWTVALTGLDWTGLVWVAMSVLQRYFVGTSGGVRLGGRGRYLPNFIAVGCHSLDFGWW